LNDTEVGDKNGRYRILVLGDSYAEANQLPREQNFTSVMEFIDRRIDVVNAGRNGMNGVDYLTMFHRLERNILPDLIVVVVSAGDLTDLRDANNLNVERDQLGRINSVTTSANAKDELKGVINPLIQQSALATHMMRRLRPVVTDVLQSIDGARGVIGSASANSTHDNTEKRLSETDAKEILGFVLTNLGAKKPVMVAYLPDMIYRESRVAEEAAPQLADVYRRLATTAGVGFVNMAGAFRDVYERTGQPPHGFHNHHMGVGHMNAAGHEAVGRSLVEWLRATGRKNMS
jgi:lysophospholipase L1-like esterase